LNFLILAAILKAVAYKPIVKMLKAREDKIAESIQKADDDEAKAKATLKEYQDQLAGARIKAQEIVDKAMKRA
jgi:F-type H+-transporting ATPase subunit b